MIWKWKDKKKSSELENYNFGLISSKRGVNWGQKGSKVNINEWLEPIRNLKGFRFRIFMVSFYNIFFYFFFFIFDFWFFFFEKKLQIYFSHFSKYDNPIQSVVSAFIKQIMDPNPSQWITLSFLSLINSNNNPNSVF